MPPSKWACESCRHLKKKCEWDKRPCSTCVRLGRECVPQILRIKLTEAMLREVEHEWSLEVMEEIVKLFR